MPPVDPRLGHDFRRFFAAYVRQTYSQLDPRTDLSIDTWLEKTSYNDKQKQILREAAKSGLVTSDQMRRKIFIKFEPHHDGTPDGLIKWPRIITFVQDVLKSATGPVGTAIDDCIYNVPHAVKGLTPTERQIRMESVFGDWPVTTGDATSMEAHHRDQLYYAVEDAINWITEPHPGARNFTVINRSNRSSKVVKSPHVSGRYHQRLDTGERLTGAKNFLLTDGLYRFLVCRTNDPHSAPEDLVAGAKRIRLLAEGDDVILQKSAISPQLVDGLGLKLKLHNHPNYRCASFCSIITDGESILTDPRKFLLKFAVIPAQYARSSDIVKSSLLRAKAMSAAHLHVDCPIVGPFCKWVLDNTRSLDVRRFKFEPHKQLALERGLKEKIWQRVPHVSSASRAVMAQEFNIPVELQLRMEAEFTGSLRPFSVPWEIPDCAIAYSKVFVGEEQKGLVPLPYLPDRLRPLVVGGKIGGRMKAPKPVVLSELPEQDHDCEDHLVRLSTPV